MTLSVILRAGCLAAFLACGTLAPAMAISQPVAASTADRAAFRQVFDGLQIFELVDASMAQGTREGTAFPDLTAPQRAAFLKAFHREMANRRESITTAFIDATIGQFSHDEIVRLSAMAALPGVQKLGAAMVASSNGDEGAMDRLDPASMAGLTHDDLDLLSRFLSAVNASKEVVISDVTAAMETAYDEAVAVK